MKTLPWSKLVLLKISQISSHLLVHSAVVLRAFVELNNRPTCLDTFLTSSAVKARWAKKKKKVFFKTADTMTLKGKFSHSAIWPCREICWGVKIAAHIRIYLAFGLWRSINYIIIFGKRCCLVRWKYVCVSLTTACH